MRRRERFLIGSLLSVVLLLVGAAVFFPVFACSKCGNSPKTACLSNEKQQAIGFIMYAGDNDERLPRTLNWMDRIGAYTKTEAVFHCPGIELKSNDAYGYAFKSGLSQRYLEDIKNPYKQPLLFDSDLMGRSVATNELPTVPFDRHSTPNIAYADGHAQSLRLPSKD